MYIFIIYHNGVSEKEVRIGSYMGDRISYEHIGVIP